MGRFERGMEERFNVRPADERDTARHTAPRKSNVSKLYTEDEDIARMVDRLGELKIQIDAFKATENEYDKLKTRLVAIANNEYPPHQPVLFYGRNFVAEIAARSFKRIITDLYKFRDIIGDRKFMEIVNVKINWVDALVPFRRHKEFVEERRMGGRTIHLRERQRNE